MYIMTILRIERTAAFADDAGLQLVKLWCHECVRFVEVVMRKSIEIGLTLLAGATCAGQSYAQAMHPATLDTAAIEQLTGAKGAYNPTEKVFKVSVPRSDLKLTIAGVKMVPALGLTSWAAFTPAADGVMVMGDTVVLESQVGPVMTTALENGLEVTALHHHFFYDSPKVMFMHIGGHGDQDKLARAVGAVFSKIRQTSNEMAARGTVNIDPAQTSLNPKKIEAIVGSKGDLKDGVFKLTFGRTSHMHGQEVGNAMGVNTWAAFAGSDTQAVVDGDFVVLESELQAVLLALRHADIEVVAIHNHMTHEEPRMVFLHYWGIGPTEKLADGLKAALRQTRPL
jgi:hypothetical protein